MQEKKITGISEIRDESDREGMRIVMELKRGEITNVVLNQLFKHTAMQSTFGVIMLALVNNQPRVLNLRRLLSSFIQHRREGWCAGRGTTSGRPRSAPTSSWA